MATPNPAHRMLKPEKMIMDVMESVHASPLRVLPVGQTSEQLPLG